MGMVVKVVGISEERERKINKRKRAMCPENREEWTYL
jgi:hypothetical protein